VGCSSLNPANDIDQAADLATRRLGVNATAAWSEPLATPSRQWNGTDPLTAEAALLVAIQNDPSIRIALARIAERRADFVQSELPPNPTIGFGIGVATDGLAGAPAFVQGLQALTWLWTRPDRMAVAEAALRESVLAAGTATVDLAEHIASDHARVLAAQDLLKFDEQNLAIAEQSLQILTRRLEVGESAPLDLDRAEIIVHTARNAITSSARSLEQAKLDLLAGIGWSGHGTDWTAAAPAGVQEPPVGDDLALCELAASQRLDLAAARIVVEQELAGLALAGARRIPDVSFTFGWQRNFNDRKAVKPGASMTIPIFDNGDPAIAKATARIDAARLQWIDLANRIEHDVRAAGSRWREAAAQSTVTDLDLLPAARSALQRSRAAFAEGAVDLTALLLAQERLIAARRVLVIQRLAEIEALIALRAAVGGTFEQLQASEIAPTGIQGEQS
jgi:cobalt-zinc-cadmium efflux system outer membrane protein